MRNRRNRFRSSVNNLDTLHIIELILEVLIVIFLIIFIFSSIKVKNNISQNNSTIQISENNEFNTNSNSITDTNNILNYDKNSNEQNNKSDNKKDEPQSTTIHMALTGDIMCHNTIYKDAYNSETDNYDFSYIFEDIKYNIQTADIAIRQLRNNFCRKVCRL